MSCIVLPCHPIWYLSEDALHHGQMFAIVVRLEECDAQVQLKQDAAKKDNIIRVSNVNSL